MKKKIIFAIIITVFILAIFSLPGFSFISLVSATQEPFLVSPKTAWEKLTSNWASFSNLKFVSPTPALTPTVYKSENDSGKINLGLARFFADVNSRFNKFNKSTDEFIYSLSDSTYSAFSKAAESAKNLNFELAISQLPAPNISGVKNLELKKVFSDQLKAVEALNPVPAVRNFLTTTNRNLTAALISTPTPTPISTPISTSTPVPTPTLTPTPSTSVSSSGAKISGIENSSLVAEHKVFKSRNSNNIYFYQNGSLRLVPDTSTLNSLGFGAGDVFVISPETFALFKIGAPIDTVISPFSNKQTSFIKSLIKQFLGEEPTPPIG